MTQQRTLRNVFGSFGTGVTVITAQTADGRQVGVTANSFSTVSLDPPIVLWSLGSHSPSLTAFDAAGGFVVNVLALPQLDLAQRFGKPGTHKFDGLTLERSHHGMPVLPGCVATLECTTVNRLVMGDHVVFFGQVAHFAHHPQPGLLFCQGQFAQSAELPAS